MQNGTSDDRFFEGGEEETVDPQLLAEMERWIRRNYKAEPPEAYPQEWLGDVERAAFSHLADVLLGENRSDKWLQNKVFKGIGSAYADFDSPLAVEEPPEKKSEEFGPQACEFLQKFGGFLNGLVAEMWRQPKYNSDTEQVSEGMMSGLAYALNPPQPGNMDQRLNFFALYPRNLTYEVILEYCGNLTLSRETSLRVRRALEDRKFLLKKDGTLSEAEIADGFRSADIVRSNKEPGVKEEFLEALKTVADDSGMDVGDGILAHLMRIVRSGRCADLEAFVSFHIKKRTLSARTKEGKRKEREVTIFSEDEKSNQKLDRQLSVSEEVNEDGVTRTSASQRHAYQREQTYEERRQKAEKAREFTAESLTDTRKLVEFISERLRAEAVETYLKKSRENKPTNDSDILGLLLPEALHYYMQAAIFQANALICPENEGASEQARRKGMRLFYKSGRSYMGFDQAGKRNLGNLVDLDGLEKHLKPYRERKKMICSLHINGKNAESIAVDAGVNINFVEDTLLQFKLISSSPMQQRLYIWFLHEQGKSADEIQRATSYEEKAILDALRRYEKVSDKDKPAGRTFDEYFEEQLTAANIKNSFSWRWGRILAILYAPVADDIANVKVFEEYRIKPEDSSDLPAGVRRKLKRVYHTVDPGALSDLVSMLTVHSYIEKGTIPDVAYAQNQPPKDGKKPQDEPGKAWGHNVCRQTGESNLRMFYDIFYGGLKRDSADHKDIRARAAEIIRMRRAKARKNGGRSDEAESEPSA
jgi:hypothetical protein